jgi:6-pyruvoyltetrahydropterin/6-carboxytetrahydropterin synthase
MKGKLTSVENLIVEIWKILYPKIQDITENRVFLHCLKIKETNKNYAEYYGD